MCYKNTWHMNGKKGLIILSISIFMFGLNISEDYGISWDETTQRFRGQEALVYVIQKIGFFQYSLPPPPT